MGNIYLNAGMPPQERPLAISRDIAITPASCLLLSSPRLSRQQIANLGRRHRAGSRLVAGGDLQPVYRVTRPLPLFLVVRIWVSVVLQLSNMNPADCCASRVGADGVHRLPGGRVRTEELAAGIIANVRGISEGGNGDMAKRVLTGLSFVGMATITTHSAIILVAIVRRSGQNRWVSQLGISFAAQYLHNTRRKQLC